MDIHIYSSYKAALWKTSSFRPHDFTLTGHLPLCLTLWLKWKINNNPDFWQLPQKPSLVLPKDPEHLYFPISLGLTYAQITMESIIAVVFHALKIFQLLEHYPIPITKKCKLSPWIWQRMVSITNVQTY